MMYYASLILPYLSLEAQNMSEGEFMGFTAIMAKKATSLDLEIWQRVLKEERERRMMASITASQRL